MIQKSFENSLYNNWLKADKFKPSGIGEKFVVLIPPPNVTSHLHLGHALNITLQDIIVRYQRMKGKNTLWIVGTDHAGIATQIIAEKKLKKEGKSKEELGKDEFVKYTFAIKDEHQNKLEIK